MHQRDIIARFTLHLGHSAISDHLQNKHRRDMVLVLEPQTRRYAACI
jgi:hypothetical protein